MFKALPCSLLDIAGFLGLTCKTSKEDIGLRLKLKFEMVIIKSYISFFRKEMSQEVDDSSLSG